MSDNFNPGYAFSWLASDLLHWAPPDDRPVLAALTLEQLSAYWRDGEARRGPGWQAFERLPDPAQRALAAGFEVRARRP